MSKLQVVDLTSRPALVKALQKALTELEEERDNEIQDAATKIGEEAARKIEASNREIEARYESKIDYLRKGIEDFGGKAPQPKTERKSPPKSTAKATTQPRRRRPRGAPKTEAGTSGVVGDELLDRARAWARGRQSGFKPSQMEIGLGISKGSRIRVLKALTEQGFLLSEGSTKDKRYRVAEDPPAPPPDQSVEPWRERILEHAKACHPYGFVAPDIDEIAGKKRGDGRKGAWHRKVLADMVREGLLTKEGKSRGTRYHLVEASREAADEPEEPAPAEDPDDEPEAIVEKQVEKPRHPAYREPDDADLAAAAHWCARQTAFTVEELCEALAFGEREGKAVCELLFEQGQLAKTTGYVDRYEVVANRHIPSEDADDLDEEGEGQRLLDDDPHAEARERVRAIDAVRKQVADKKGEGLRAQELPADRLHRDALAFLQRNGEVVQRGENRMARRYYASRYAPKANSELIRAEVKREREDLEAEAAKLGIENPGNLTLGDLEQKITAAKVNGNGGGATFAGRMLGALQGHPMTFEELAGRFPGEPVGQMIGDLMREGEIRSYVRRNRTLYEAI